MVATSVSGATAGGAAASAGRGAKHANNSVRSRVEGGKRKVTGIWRGRAVKCRPQVQRAYRKRLNAGASHRFLPSVQPALHEPVRTRHQPPDRTGRIARARCLRRRRRCACAGGPARAAAGARSGVAVHLQPYRVVRGGRRRRQRAGRLAGHPSFARQRWRRAGAGTGAPRLPLPPPGRRCGAASVPRRDRAGFPCAGRAADPRPGQARLGHRARRGDPGRTARPLVPACLRHRQAGTHRNPHRQQPGVGGVGGGAAGAGVVRAAVGFDRAADRRRRDHRTGRAPSRPGEGEAIAGRQSHLCACPGPGHAPRRRGAAAGRARPPPVPRRHRVLGHRQSYADPVQGAGRRRTGRATAPADAAAGPCRAARHRAGRGHAQRCVPVHRRRPRARGRGQPPGPPRGRRIRGGDRRPAGRALRGSTGRRHPQCAAQAPACARRKRPRRRAGQGPATARRPKRCSISWPTPSPTACCTRQPWRCARPQSAATAN